MTKLRNAEEEYPYIDNPEDDLCIREHNQRMFDKREVHNKILSDIRKVIAEKIDEYKKRREELISYGNDGEYKRFQIDALTEILGILKEEK